MSKFDVKAYGHAVGDGVTDDTAAIQKTINDAAAAMYSQGGAGVIYFPESSGFYKVSTLRFPSMNYSQGWLTSVFDNGLMITGSIFPGTANAFIGRTSNYAALGGSFVWGPFAQWEKDKSSGGPVVDIEGLNGVYFEGIGFGNANGGTCVHMHNNAAGHGCVWTKFRRCAFFSDLLITPSPPNNSAGFGLRMDECSLQGKIDMTNFGMVVVRDSFVHNMIARGSGGITLEGILSESLNNQDFFEWHSPYSDQLLMTRVEMADSVNAYLIKLVNDGLPSQNWTPHIKLVMCNGGTGYPNILNPASSWAAPGIWVEGEGANSDLSGFHGGVLGPLRSVLYSGVEYYPKGGLKVYGSQWLKTPFQVIT